MQIMSLEGPLLAILACPIDKGGLLYFGDEGILYNPRLRRVYRVIDGRPVMLADRAEPTGDEDHARLLKRARHGEAISCCVSLLILNVYASNRQLSREPSRIPPSCIMLDHALVRARQEH